MEKLKNVLNPMNSGLSRDVFDRLFAGLDEKKKDTVFSKLSSGNCRYQVNPYVFLQCGKRDATVVEKSKLFRKTYEVEAVSKKIKLEEMAPEDLGALCIPDFLVNAVRCSDGVRPDYGSWNFNIRNIVYEARKELRSEVSDRMKWSMWAKFLFSSHNFDVAQQLFAPQMGIPLQRFKDLHREFKECFQQMYEKKEFLYSGKGIYILNDENMLCPQISVRDINGQIEKDLSGYTIRELLNMHIAADLDRSKRNGTVILLYIYSCYMYPIRMKRLSQTPETAEPWWR